MSHLVVINLGVGDLQNGYANVIAQVSQRGDSTYPMQFVGSLPPAPDLEQLYRRWQLLYREFYRSHSLNLSKPRAITISPSGVTHFSAVEFGDLAQQLRQRLNQWLNAESFHPIDRKLSRLFDSTDPLQVIIQTNDPILRRLPWHLWNFFEDFPQAEVTLSVAAYERVTSRPAAARKVRILAVLGNSHQLDLQGDRRAIAALSDADVVFLTEPSYSELHEHLWDDRGWNILFFAGHSKTESYTDAETGRIYINPQESLTLDQMRNALKRAIQRGLKLAIFNSCDGLGLAQALADLNIPQVVVMRELVPDAVAQTFFQDFLTRFAKGYSLYAAVREAREKLEKLEDEYPCATWLPLICQNPAAEPIQWHTPASLWPPAPFTRLRLPFLGPMAIATLITTIAALGLRSLGVFQSLELRAFDQLLQLRPAEPPDPRLLLITITEQDVQQQNAAERRGASISDRTLAQLLEKLRPHQPRVVGLDIYRDAPLDPTTNLTAQLQQMPQFVAVCEVGEGGGTRPLAGIPGDRIGFSDLPIDPDGVVRRQILGMASAPGACETQTSFSFRLAQLYLAQQNIHPDRDETGTVKLGDRPFPQLLPHSGGYHQLDALGYQIMLNYRTSGSPAEQVTLGEVLDGTHDAQLADLVRDRIIIIGTVAPSFKDYFFTPFSQANTLRKMPGVILQAQMTSQLLSAVLDHRPLLGDVPTWGLMIWVGGWGAAGGTVVLLRQSRRAIGLAGVALLVGLGCASYLALWAGVWLPLVPAAFGSVTTGVIVYGLKKLELFHQKV
ncbi:MAG: CHASE2 domain-containing protein [Oculatellaceae cyanobacterium Prado106]|jgi:CHASE2 domain-containing sensor protein|nr:CHASE2 domain-containing protein [Oculatellaceae cyanobacterium Prado106]